MTNRMHKLALVAVVVGGAVASSAPAAKSRPVIAFDVPTVSGALDTKALEVVVKRTQPKLLACFTKAASDEVDATVTFTVASDGKVTTAETTGPSDDIAACITGSFLKLEFAASKETSGVVYPLAFARLYPPQILGTNPISSGGDISNGTGSGYGIGYGGTRPSPLVSVGQPTVTGDLDKAVVRRFIKRNIPKLQYCYEKELLVTKTLQGKITAEFTITANGTVGTSTASGIKSKNVESCVASVIQNIEFPKPKGGADVTVTSPLTFTPPPPPAKKTK